MTMTLQRLLALAAPAAVCGLQMHDAGETQPQKYTYVTGAGVVNDPEADLPADGVKYHIRREGAQTLIGLPKDFMDYPEKNDTQKREDAGYVATGDFEMIGPKDDTCDDHFLRSVEIQGTRLEKTIKPFGGNATVEGDVVVKRLKFFVDEGEHAFDDSVYNTTSGLGFEFELLNKTTGVRTIHTLSGRSIENLTFMNYYVPYCNVHRPLGEITMPTKRTFRHASHFMSVTCVLTNLEDGNIVWHEFGVMYQTTWGGVVNPDSSTHIWRKSCGTTWGSGSCNETLLNLTEVYPYAEPEPAHPTIDWYTTNLWFWASNVTADPAGLLGPHTTDERDYAAIDPPAGCYKPNVNGGKQYLKPPARRGPKHPRHWK